MGRNIGTNVYSNNFEPQVMGLLDARTRVDTKADLTKEATWTSSDGNTYAPVGIRVSVTDDSTSGNNGVYMLMSEDYAIASNWMKIGSEGSAELVMVDLSTVNTIPGTYTPDRYLMGEFIKIQDALSIDTPFFIYQFDNQFGQFPASATIEGDIFELSILYRDEVWFVNFDGSQYTTSKGGTSPLTNVKVLTTSSLLNTSRKGNLYLSSSDVTIWKNIELGRDIIVYSGSIAQEKQYVPLSISSNGTGSAQVGRVTYMLNGSMYSFKIEYVNPSVYTAGDVTKIENSGDKTIYLTTDGMLDIGGDTELNQQDIDAITKLYTENNSSITNIVYVGSESGGNQFLVPLSCYSDFGGESPMDVLFLHPWQQKVYHMTIDIFATPPIAYDPEEVIFGGGSSTSNVKVLTTPDLLNTSRTSSIDLSAADIAILKGLSVGKDMVTYSGTFAAAKQYIPLSINSMESGTTKVMLVTFLFSNSIYYFTISIITSSNTYTAGKIYQAEGSGGGSGTVKTYTMPSSFEFTLDYTSFVDLNVANMIREIASNDVSDKVCVIVVGNYYYNVTTRYIDGSYVGIRLSDSTYTYEITTTNDNSSDYSVSGFELQTVLVSGTNIKTINGNSILGQGNLVIESGGSSKFYTTTLNLGDISTRENKASSDAERVEVDNIISKVQEGYTIISVQNDIGVNDSHSRYGVVAVDLSEDRQEIWMQVIDQWNVLTISYNKKVLGAPFHCYYLQKRTEIVELPSDASANMPYENGDYNGSNQDFANKIREISINPTDNYILKFSPTGYYTVINPYRASSYAGFYIATSEGENYHIYTSITTSDRSYTIQSEGSYSLKQDTLVSGKNIKTINGQSLLGSGNIAISGSGSGGEGAYLTTLDLWGTITSDLLYQEEYDEIVNIYNKYKAGIPVVISMRDHYQGTLNIYSNYGGITDRSTITFTIIYGDYVESWSVLMKVGSSWERTYKKLPTEISLYDIVANNATDLTTSDGKELYDSIMMLDSLKRDGSPIYASSFDSLTGHHPISIRDTFSSFVVNYSGREFQIDYQINRDNTITYSVTDVTKHDLSIDVKAGSDGIYYRIREVVPNGFIQFVRKKKKNYYSISQTKWFSQTTYSPMRLSFDNKKVGVSVSTLTPNVWYKFPITDEELVNTYTAGSKNPEGIIVTYNMYKFSGNTHAKPIYFAPNGGTIGSKRTTVLNAGLQYNVLDASFVSGKSAKTIFKQRGDICKIDVRLSVNNINTFASGYKLVYAIK